MPIANAGNKTAAKIPAQSPVSRAENKIAGAAQAFRYDFRGKTVLDIGSSTGGFTEYALNHGAEKVFAVEKGTNQMKAPLRFDSRISLREKTDIFDVTRENLGAAGANPAATDKVGGHAKKPSGHAEKPGVRIDTILADVSFISLTKVLSHAKTHIASKNTDFLVMLKPQFEARPDQLNKGIVKNEKIRREIIKNFELWLKNNGFIIANKRDNTLSGKNGNVERFYLLNIGKK